MFIFGLNADQVASARSHAYDPAQVYYAEPMLRSALDAVAQGAFSPDDPSRFPPVLAKGAYRREAVEIDRKLDEAGKTTSITTVDCPRLTVTLLRLDTGTFHTLAEGTEPAGGDDLAAWTAADLLIHYGRSMADLLRRQFPPLHDPADPGGRIALPELARRPFTAQDHAVQTALKLPKLVSGGSVTGSGRRAYRAGSRYCQAVGDSSTCASASMTCMAGFSSDPAKIARSVPAGAHGLPTLHRLPSLSRRRYPVQDSPRGCTMIGVGSPNASSAGWFGLHSGPHA